MVAEPGLDLHIRPNPGEYYGFARSSPREQRSFAPHLDGFSSFFLAKKEKKKATPFGMTFSFLVRVFITDLT